MASAPILPTGFFFANTGSWVGPKNLSGLGDAKYYGSSGRDLANCELPLQSQGADALGPEPA